MSKTKFINKYENYKERQGTVQKGKSKTITEFAEETNIYNCIEKYGITALMRQTEATDFYYDDYNNHPKTIMERVQQRENLNEYFRNLPARVRKDFGDSPEVFYQKYKNGDFETMLNKGILNEELTKAYSYKEEVKNEQQTQQNISNGKDIPADTSKSNN